MADEAKAALDDAKAEVEDSLKSALDGAMNDAAEALGAEAPAPKPARSKAADEKPQKAGHVPAFIIAAALQLRQCGTMRGLLAYSAATLALM